MKKTNKKDDFSWIKKLSKEDQNLFHSNIGAFLHKAAHAWCEIEKNKKYGFTFQNNRDNTQNVKCNNLKRKY